MTAFTAAPADLLEARPESTQTTRPTRDRARAARRGFLVASPALAGILLLVATIADPGAGTSGPEMNRLYTENPGALQVHTLVLHWSYAFWAGTALVAAAYVRGRGAWLANIGAVLGFVAMTTLPGLLAVDWYDSALGQTHGVAAVEQLHQHMSETMWALPLFAAPGIIGLVLCLPVAAGALWRGRVVHWWAFVAALAGTATFIASGVQVWGVAISAVMFAVLSVDLARGTRSPRA